MAWGLLSCRHQGLTALPGYGVRSYTLLLHKYVSFQRHTATLNLPDGNISTVTTELHRLTGKKTVGHGKSAALHMPGFEKGDKLTAAGNRCGYGWQSVAARSILVTTGESKHDHIERFQHVYWSRKNTQLCSHTCDSNLPSWSNHFISSACRHNRHNWAPGECLPYLLAWSFVHQSLGILYLLLYLPKEIAQE